MVRVGAKHPLLQEKADTTAAAQWYVRSFFLRPFPGHFSCSEVGGCSLSCTSPALTHAHAENTVGLPVHGLAHKGVDHLAENTAKRERWSIQREWA